MFWTVEDLPLSCPQIAKKTCQFMLKHSFEILLITIQFSWSSHYYFFFFPIWKGVAGDALPVRNYFWKVLPPHSQLPANCPSPAEAEICGGPCHEMPKSDIKPSMGWDPTDPELGWVLPTLGSQVRILPQPGGHLCYKNDGKCFRKFQHEG